MVRLVVFVLVMAALVGAGIFFLERERPQITLEPELACLGRTAGLAVTVSDHRSGVRSVKVALIQGEKEYTLASRLVAGRGSREERLETEIRPLELDLKDGEAELKIEAIDYSPLKNLAIYRRTLSIDTTPPRLELLSRQHYLTPGGSCLALYRVSPDTHTSGVRLGGAFFPGYPARQGAGEERVCYFTLPLGFEGAQSFTLLATDAAGNEAQASLPVHVRQGPVMRSSTLKVGTGFIEAHVAAFRQHYPAIEGRDPRDAFAFLNEQVRRLSDETIRDVCARSAPEQLWQGRFLRMHQAAATANFGDRRTYTLEGRVIGKSLHLGVDLASTRNAPIQAANAGVVTFAAFLGLYGNTVIIDHGQGIASLYGHMHTLDVEPGQVLTRGDFLGSSGQSGFAGGDHLHFGLLLGGMPVNPREWWDAHWIQDNVERKLAELP